MKSIKNLFAKILVAAILFMSAQNVTAGITEPGTAKVNSIVFVKSEGDDVVFKTDLQLLPAGGCTLEIRDEKGNVLFSENIQADNHQKLYRINRENMNGIYFEVRSKKFSFKQSFNFESKMEEVFTVKKIQ